jgi:hypothetical protein
MDFSFNRIAQRQLASASRWFYQSLSASCLSRYSCFLHIVITRAYQRMEFFEGADFNRTKLFCGEQF